MYGLTLVRVEAGTRTHTHTIEYWFLVMKKSTTCSTKPLGLGQITMNATSTFKKMAKSFAKKEDQIAGKEYGHVCQLIRHKQTDSEAILLKVYLHALVWYRHWFHFMHTHSLSSLQEKCVCVSYSRANSCPSQDFPPYILLHWCNIPSVTVGLILPKVKDFITPSHDWIVTLLFN